MKKILLIILLISFGVCMPAFAKKQDTAKKPFIVTFYKKDCEECDALDEVKKEIIREYKNKVDFVRINFDYEDCDFDKLKAKYNITSAPTTLFINVDKGITKKKEGFISYKEYESKIKAVIGE